MVYEGQWAYDCCQGWLCYFVLIQTKQLLLGQGTLTYPDGTVYQGEFEDGEKHGKGTMLFPDKTKLTGEWIRNIIAKGVIITK